MYPKDKILKDYAYWTVLSALRRAPVRSKIEIYWLISRVDFNNVLDASKGHITSVEFENWHFKALETIIAAKPNGKLKYQYGWAAKIINIYLKTYCYIGGSGRTGISECLHPPIDRGLWKGVRRKFQGDYALLKRTHAVNSIGKIKSHDTYMEIIGGLRQASEKIGCKLIEIEQFWEQ